MAKKDKMKEKTDSHYWFRDVRILIKENKKIALITVIFLALAGSVIGVSSVLANSKEEEVMTKVAAEAAAEVSENAQADSYIIPDDPLEIDAYPEINALMKRYYQAAANGDVDTIAELKTNLDDNERIVLKKKSEYIESYPVVTCYTKKGPVEDSFLVFAYYEVKLKEFDIASPGLNAWYVSKNQEGNYTITDDVQDEKLADYCKIISVQDDVVDLNNTVNVRFNELLKNNNEFAQFMTSLPEVLTSQVGEELAKVEAEAVGESQENSTETEAEESSEPIIVRAKTVVNVRKSDSETADKIGVARTGDEFQLVEAKLNGWSKILFEEKEAFIKSEFLESDEPIVVTAGTEIVQASVEEDNQNREEEAEADSKEQIEPDTSEKEEVKEDTAKEKDTKEDSSPSSGKARATTTIKLREKAGTDSEQIGVIYGGEKVEVIEKEDNGWTKVKFENKEGYVKSEFIE